MSNASKGISNWFDGHVSMCVYLHVLQTQTDQFEEFRDLILQRTPIDRYTYNIM